jgi:hypothetical protein
MKKATILTTALFLASFAFTTQGYAQDANNFATMGISAEVLEIITITSDPLSFGDVLPGVEKTIAPDEGGLFSISGDDSENHEIQLQWEQAPPVNLTNGSNNLPIEWSILLNGNSNTTDADTWSSEDFNSAQTKNLTSGSYYVLVGGSVDPAHNQAAGTYDATIEIEVIYTALGAE